MEGIVGIILFIGAIWVIGLMMRAGGATVKAGAWAAGIRSGMGAWEMRVQTTDLSELYNG